MHKKCNITEDVLDTVGGYRPTHDRQILTLEKAKKTECPYYKKLADIISARTNYEHISYDMDHIVPYKARPKKPTIETTPTAE